MYFVHILCDRRFIKKNHQPHFPGMSGRKEDLFAIDSLFNRNTSAASIELVSEANAGLCGGLSP